MKKDNIKFELFLDILDAEIKKYFEIYNKQIDKSFLIKIRTLKEFEQFNEYSDAHIMGMISYPYVQEKIQFFLIENFKYIEKDNKDTKSIFFEKLAQLFNKINDIIDQYLDKNLADIKIKKIFNNKKITYLKEENIISKIKKQNRYKESYSADSHNIIIDFGYNKCFEQYVHATSNVDTQSGQGKLIFNINDHDNQNIYIIDKIIKNNHKGFLFKEESVLNKNINLLPFLSIISKITPLLSKITSNENLIYFFRTPLILIDDKENVCSEYNKIMASFYSKKKICEREWYYSFFFERRNEDKIKFDILNYLKKYTLEIIGIIDFDNINGNLQSNEKLILQQLYNLVKSVIFFGNKDDDYKNKTSDFVNKVLFYNNNYENLKIKDFNMIKKFSIENVLELDSIKKKCYMKMKLEVLKQKCNRSEIEKYLFANFLEEIEKELMFKNSDISSFLRKNKDKNFDEVVESKEFKNILIENKNLDMNSLADLVYHDFPKIFIKDIFKCKDSDKSLIYLLFFLFIEKSDRDLFLDSFYLNLENNASYGYGHFKEIDDPYLRIYVLFEFFYPMNQLNWSIKKDIKLKRIIHKYAFYYSSQKLSNLLDELMDKNNLKDTDVNSVLDSTIEFYESQVSDEIFFNELLELEKKYNLSPIDYAIFLKNNLHQYILILFLEFLEKNKKEIYLKQAIQWLLSNKYF